ncbi:nuclear transport factor 2 family protein [Novosphingobium sp. MMS21-SN21R]|uniref:nuclear transport factor 2 family protein n=1 Tax=Novosphingobium sp. MMS21-SN21R TaxID=2969298 RepID=UPI0028856257|nr:nuclear transport factor 2 family protein [Novosphingobium sp. MMS21-SN21R]MDT0508198.1 nuclear transport factor 2 family protein [Novosphingobium sp. MMS21-SN21R]
MTADPAIRLARAEFNRALATADLAAIGPLLSPDVVLVTGTDSAVIVGRKAQLLAWKREFAVPDRTLYTRTTETIAPSAAEPIAMELGRWQAVSAGVRQHIASGTYAAKWRKVREQWVLVAEIFVTLA